MYTEPLAHVVLLPGFVHGNRLHTRDSVRLTVLYTDRWTLLLEAREESFEGTGAMMVEIEPHRAYAIRNAGCAPLFILGDRDDDAEPHLLTSSPARLAGLDGCPRGWIAMVKDGDVVEPRLCTTDNDLLGLAAECAVVAIDIPIGLSDRGPRSCDHHARRLLRNRASCVFPAPLRPLIALREYAEANRLARQLQKRGISKQGFAIFAKVAQIDHLLQRHHELRGRVVEVHPEVSFAAWNDGVPLAQSKHSKEGLAARRLLVEARYGAVPHMRGAREDDVLDACAALWTAERIAAGHAVTLSDGHEDVTGLPMRIVY
jgi:predicted RNase H-like nuclease